MYTSDRKDLERNKENIYIWNERVQPKILKT